MWKIIFASVVIALGIAAASAHWGATSHGRLGSPSANGASLSGLASYGVVRPLTD